MCPPLWSHFDHWANFEFDLKEPINLSSGYSSTKPWGFFHNLSTTCLSHSSKVLSKFAQKFVLILLNHLSSGLIESLCENWPNWDQIKNILKETQWICSWANLRQFMKELLMSGLDMLWTNYERNPRVLWKNTHWINWWVLWDQIQNLPIDQSVIKVVGTFRTNSKFAPWIFGEQITQLFSICSQCIHWVNGGLPPVPGHGWSSLVDVAPRESQGTSLGCISICDINQSSFF